jgi:hypothetical protein
VLPLHQRGNTWWMPPGLNRRPRAYQARALPTELDIHVLAEGERFERSCRIAATHRVPAGADRPLLHPSLIGASPRMAAITHPGATRQVMARCLPRAVGSAWLGMSSVAACFLAEDGALEAHAFRRPLFSRQCRHACPVHLPYSGRGAVNRTPEILLPKQATYHWPTPRLTGCGRRNRTVSPAYEAGVLPLHHLRKTWLPRSGSNGRRRG